MRIKVKLNNKIKERVLRIRFFFLEFHGLEKNDEKVKKETDDDVFFQNEMI